MFHQQFPRKSMITIFFSLLYVNVLTFYLVFLSRQHVRALRVVANDYVDEILSVAHSYIVENGLSNIAIPNIEASFSQEVSSIHTNIAHL